MKRLMKLKFVSPSLQKVVAVVRASNADDTMLREYVEAPEDKSDSELIGTFIRTGGTPTPQKKTLFVIPTYHANEKLERCLKTLREQHDGKMDYEVVIVHDGGPNIDSAIMLAAKYEAQLVPLEKNSGFSAAVNAGIQAGDEQAENIILVNDDLWFEMPSGAFLAEVLEKQTDVALVGALLLYPNGKIQHAGKPSASGHYLHGKPITPEAFIDREIMGVTGAFLGISKKFLEQVMRLDESYSMAWEDADLCLTAHTLGWKVFYCGQACAYHDEGGTRGASPNKKKEFTEWKLWEDEGRKTFENKWGTDYTLRKWHIKPSRSLLNRLILKRTTALGDVLLTTPIVRALREKKPDWEIIVATSHPFIYRDNPDVNYVVPVGHEWVVSKDCEAFYELDLAYEIRPDIGILKAYAEACNVNVKDPWPRVYLREQNRLFASSVLADSYRWVVIHPGPKGWPGGDWPWERFSEIAEDLQKKGLKIVLVGNTPPDPIKCDLDLRHKTTFHNLAAIIERSSLFVGIDSMPLHLAEAFRRPCVGVFGCVSPERVLTKSDSVRGATADIIEVPCLGCHHRGDFPKMFSGCNRDRVYCMEKLSSGKVLSTIDKLISGR